MLDNLEKMIGVFLLVVSYMLVLCLFPYVPSLFLIVHECGSICCHMCLKHSTDLSQLMR